MEERISTREEEIFFIDTGFRLCEEGGGGMRRQQHTEIARRATSRIPNMITSLRNPDLAQSVRTILN
jgi:hypothetical protein